MAIRPESQAVAIPVAAFRPERIILFGSHAFGKPTRDSAFDLLVALKREGHPAAKAAEPSDFSSLVGRRVKANAFQVSRLRRFAVDQGTGSPR